MTTKLKRAGAVAGVAVLAMAVIGSFAFSQSTRSNQTDSPRPFHGRHFRGGGHGFGMGFGMAGARDFRQLNLTDDQKAQIKQIRESHFDSLATVREQLRTAMKALHDSSSGATIDEALITQKLTEIAPLRAKLMADSFQMRQEMTSVLTPDQKAKLDQLRQQAQTRRAGFRARKTRKSSQE